jgi:hypothetical protein
MKTKILLIKILILIGNLIKGQETVSWHYHDNTYPVNLQFGLNQVKEINLLPLVNKKRLTELSFETETVKISWWLKLISGWHYTSVEMFDNFNELADPIIKG